MHNTIVQRLGRAITSVVLLASGLYAAHAAPASHTCDLITSGLRAPIGSVLTRQGNLLISETGIINVPASGRISIVSPDGARRTLLDGLPQGTNAAGGDASGPNSLSMRGRTVYVAIGQGDSVILGPVPGSALPNPNVSSPIFSSILAVHVSAAVEQNTEGFMLTEPDQARLAAGDRVVLSNGGGDRITIEMIVNFPDYESEPLPALPENVRNSNPYDVIAVNNNLYVTNGGLNRLVQVDLPSGEYAELTRFERIPNLPGAAGPPSVEAVPTGIAYSDGTLLVALFSGAPFLPGLSKIVAVDPVSGDQIDFITGLRTAIDVRPVRHGNDVDYLVLENNFAPAPPFPPTGAAIRFFETPDGAGTPVGGCPMDRPTSISLDDKSGVLYVTELLQGTLLRTRLNLE